MTPRERIRAVMHFRKPDRLPWYETFFDETIIHWIQEGLPIQKIVSEPSYESVFGGACILAWPKPLTFHPNPYFGCGGWYDILIVPIDLSPIPRYVSKTIEETERYRVYRAEHGAIMKVLRGKGKEYFMPQFMDFPVKNQKDWEKYKERLDPDDPRRYPKNWNKEETIEFYESSSHPVVIDMAGFYGFGMQIMGIAPFCTAFYSKPELIRDMVEFYADFLVRTLRECVETLKSRVDFVYWWEDMAERHGPNISPKLFREFMLSGYKRVTRFFSKNGIDSILLDTDGNIEPLIPLLIEGGIKGLWPLEVAAGMDAIRLRKKYGRQLFMMGNIDKRALTSGKEAIRNEVNSKVPALKESGGYVPGLDHLVPPNIPLKNFKYYAEYLSQYL